MTQTALPARISGTRINEARPISTAQSGSGAPTEEAIQSQLLDIVHPATLAQVELFQSLGLRARTLTLPVMVALVISLIWRQMGSVSELGRVINRGAVLWVPRIKVSMQAIHERLRVIPSHLFMNVLIEVLPIFRRRWEERKRPLPEAMAWVRDRYSQVLICDGSTLDALIRKTGLLIEEVKHPLAGRMISVFGTISWSGLCQVRC